MALLGSTLNHFPWEYAHYVGIENSEGMPSSDFLMANQIAWLGKYPHFEQDGCNISYHCLIGLIFWYDGLTDVPEGTKYRQFLYDLYLAQDFEKRLQCCRSIDV